MALTYSPGSGAEPARPAPTNDSDPANAFAYTGRLRRLFNAFEGNKRREITEQRESRRYYSGRQWDDEQIAKLEKRKQPVIWDNRICRKVDFLVGIEQRMRRDPKAYARNPDDQKSADVATASLRYVCDDNRFEVVASDSAHDGMVSGVGIAWVGIERSPRGTLDVKIKRGQNDRFFYDPRSTLPDFSDARYMGMHLWLDREDVKAEYPDMADAVDGMFDVGAGTSYIDIDRAEQWADFERNRVRVVEMYERKIAPQGPAWYYCKFTGAVVLDSMWSPFTDEFGIPDCPYIAWSPYIDERGDRYGVVRNMRPMQDEVNQRRSKLLHITNVRQIHYRGGVVEDVEDTREQLARPDGAIKHEGNWGEDIGIIDQAIEFRGQSELLAQAQSALENLGPNPGLIGKGGGVADQSGRAILAQRDSGMTELSPVFERLRDWKLRCYRKAWARIKQAWTGERFVRITDDPKAPQYIGINQVAQDPQTGAIMTNNMVAEIDVDIILDEGPDVMVMQEELMQTLANMGPIATGPMGKVLIELSQVPNKDQLLAIMDKAMAPPPDVVAMNERMNNLELMIKQSTLAKTNAEVENKRADTAVKLREAFVPPETLASIYPIEFGDSIPPAPPGMQGQNPGTQAPPQGPPGAMQGPQGPPMGAQMPPDALQPGPQGGEQPPLPPGPESIENSPNLPPGLLRRGPVGGGINGRG
jgi:hypothetical protein